MNVITLPCRLLTGSCSVDTCSTGDIGAGAQRTEESASWLRSPLGWHKYANEPLGFFKASDGKINPAGE